MVMIVVVGRKGEVNAAAASKIDSSNINFMIVLLSLSAAYIGSRVSPGQR